jgi:hypothetical protein
MAAVDAERRVVAAQLAAIADRLDSLAEIAELMDDDGSAARFREAGARWRAQAMERLDPDAG